MSKLSGVFPVLPTPFAADNSVDPAALKRVLEFVLGVVESLSRDGDRAQEFPISGLVVCWHHETALTLSDFARCTAARSSPLGGKMNSVSL